MTRREIDEVVFLVEEEPEVGGYCASCSRWGMYTQGEDLDDLRAMVREAVTGRFENESKRPERIRLHFVRDEEIFA